MLWVDFPGTPPIPSTYGCALLLVNQPTPLLTLVSNSNEIIIGLQIVRGGRKRFISATYNYSVNCILYLEFHVNPNSCNTKLANCGDDWGLLDIRIVLSVNIKLLFFFVKPLGFLGEIDKTLFRV